ncbi:hypothetical protein TWF481_000479 [Arthrobotrys musiformis]|uniref:Uncharacterized protein n=1 Tax=Arthrobotrys musiformis TaxID=47236 RepID=A0AAV9WNL8_9PEZI
MGQGPEAQARAFAQKKAEEFQRLPTIGDYVVARSSDPEHIKAREEEEEGVRKAREGVEREKREWDSLFMRDFPGNWESQD